METKLNKSKYLLTAICVVLLITSIFCVLLGSGQQESKNIAQAADATLNSHYSAFAQNSTYRYTDLGKVESAHSAALSGAAAVDDTSLIKIDRAQTHGSIYNPYVITNITQWNYFATNSSSGATDASKVFVLGADINFSGQTFNAVASFAGKFYGGGHTLSNITKNFGALNECGVFRAIGANAVLADINLDNVNISSTGGRVGSLLGSTIGGDVLNCHVKGSVTGNTLYEGSGDQNTVVTYPVGGLIGHATGDNQKVYIYRCSENVKISILTTPTYNGRPVGGLLGGYSCNSGTLNTYIYDCNAIVNLIFPQTSNDIWFGGITNYIGFLGDQFIENCVAYTSVNSYPTNGRVSFASLFNSWGLYTKKITIKNIFTEGTLKLNGDSATYNLPSALIFNGWESNNLAATTPITSSNLNWYADKTVMGTVYGTVNSSNVDIYTSRPLTNKKYTGSTNLTHADYYNAAQSSMSSGIWKQKSNITTAFMTNTDVTSTAGYTIDKAPNRNTDIKPKDFTLKYVNLESGVENEYSGNSTTYSFGDTSQMYTPSDKADHTFLGWTLDKSDTSAPIKNIPTALYGDVTAYAVWDVPAASITSESIISGESDGAFVKEYSKTGSLTLKADIKVTGMTNPTVKYAWRKQGQTTVLSTSSTFSISKVADSGDYVLDYVVTDSVETLWSHSGSTSAQKAEITPGQVFLKDDSFKINDSTRPYMGKRLRDIQFVAVMVDSFGTTVEGTPSWDAGINQVKDGTNNEKIKFIPDDANYSSSGTYDVTFVAEYITLTFNMADVSDSIVVNLKYQDSYSTSVIVNEFYKEYKDRMENDPKYAPLNNMTPKFDGVDINDYSGSYNNVTESKTIQVTFEDTKYTVTFDPDNGEPTFTNTSTLYYNNRLPRPSNTPVNGDQLFLGWYFNETIINGDGTTTTQERAWDFDNDRVTKDMTLTAKWLNAQLTLDSIEVKTNKTSYTATEQIKSGDLTVTAHYVGNVAGYGEVSQDVVLQFGQYTIAYENTFDNALHVNQNHITVSYTYNGVTKSCTPLEMPVVAKKIDTSSLTFSDKTAVYSGSAVSIDKIRKPWPDEIVDIRYVYSKGGQPIDEADVIDAGTYVVQAVFDFGGNDDYSAEPLRATLRIRAAGDMLTAKWSEKNLSYNGTSQHPTVTFVDSDDNEVEGVDFHYEGDIDVKDVGNNYKIKVVIDGEAFQVDSTSEECSFVITKAVLNVPTVKSDSEIAYDGTPKSIESFLDGYDSNLMKISSGGSGTDAGDYTAIIELTADSKNCEWSGVSGKTYTLEWSISKAKLTAIWDGFKHVADGNEFQPKVTGFVGLASVDANGIKYDTDITYTGDTGKKDVGAYTITAVINQNAPWSKNYILETNGTRPYAIIPQEGVQVITIEWENTDLVFNGKVQMPSYKAYDENGNDITEQVKDVLTFGGDYDKSKWADDYSLSVNQPESGYYIMSGLTCDYSISIDENGNGYNPNPDDNGDKDNGFSLDEIGKILKEYWQAIASGVCLIFLIAFTLKGISNIGKTKKVKKTTENKYKAYYAAATGAFGLATTVWNVIFGVVAGLTVLSLVFMIITKSKLNKAQEEMDEAKEEFDRNKAELAERKREEENARRDENMRMMFMGMFGGGNGNSNGGQGMPQFVQQGIGADEMRGLISETVTALLPGMQQMLPQQASANDELVQKLLEKEEKNDETIKKLMEQNEKLMQKLSEKPERVVEKEVAASNINEELIKSMIEGQKAIMQKLANQPTTERIVEKERSANNQDETINKLMEKIVELSANQKNEHKIIERVVEKPVEKIVEKEVRVEVPVEKVVEKVVEKPVAVNITSTAAESPKQVKPAPKKEAAPRLTLEEAYAKLTKEQKKYFDGLREYAMKKDSKCKEKLATYFTTIGPSTTNPLIKLTIKKGVTVALFKMEDEYLKDIRRNAGSDGTKVKVKETEVPIGDAQAFDTAKDMIDLRIDQIERYEDFMKEQRAMKRK